MNLQTLRFEFMMEHGDEVTIIADAIVDGTYYFLACENDEYIYAYGTEEVGYEYKSLAEVGEPYQEWFRNAMKEM